jgi:hypothetical protein
MSTKTAKTAKVNPGGVMKTATSAKTTTKPMSAKDYAQYLRYLRTHKAKKASKARKARKLAAPCAGGWVAGGNDVAETCAMAAIANSLFMVTGIAAPDEEILAFGEGLTIKQALDACGGLAGVRLRDAFPVDSALPGVVVGLDLDEGSHAALLAGGGLMVSWGGLIPARGLVEEAWALDWGLA